MVAKPSPSADNEQGPRPGWGLLVVGGVLIAGFVLHCLAVNYVSDDGFIAFQYVRNWVDGHGPVYNPGERVEGYNNFLWIVLLAGFQWALPAVKILTIAQVLGILFGALTILLALWFSRKASRGFWPFGVVGAAFLAAHPGLSAWATAGLETTLIAFLILLAAVLYVRALETQRNFSWVAVVLALAAMTRPDGAVIFAVISSHFFVVEWRRTGKPFSKRIWQWVLAFAVVYGSYFLWRYTYYGYLLPNTAYAKVGSGLEQYLRGWNYLWRYLQETGGSILLLPVCLLLFHRKRKLWQDCFALLLGVHWLFIIYVGGDGLAFFRFPSYSAPLFYLLAQEGLAQLYHRIRNALPAPAARWIAIPSGALVVLMLAWTARYTIRPLVLPERSRWYEPQSELRFPGLGSDHAYRWFDNYFVDRLATAARWLENNSPPGAVIASTPAGSIAYHMNRKVIDMLGLTDIHIAHAPGTFRGRAGLGRAGHEKGDGKYVLSREPDYILMGNVAVLPFPLDERRMEEKLVLKSEHELWALPEFHQRYELVCVRLANSGLFQYFTFYRKKTVAVSGGKTEARGGER